MYETVCISGADERKEREPFRLKNDLINSVHFLGSNIIQGARWAKNRPAVIKCLICKRQPISSLSLRTHKHTLTLLSFAFRSLNLCVYEKSSFAKT